MQVQVVPPNAAWPSLFAEEAHRIYNELGSDILELHHIGSTAINAIFAKPVIDMLLVVRDLKPLDHRSPEWKRLGYQVMGEYGIPGRRYYRKDSNVGLRTHQVHSFLRGSADIERHIAFRDYMNAHPETAHSYSNLKRRLAEAHSNSIEAYMDGKNSFVKKYESIALAWKRSTASAA